MPELIQLTSDEQTIRYEIANLQNYTINLVSNGFGTFWVNIPTVHWIKFPNRLDIEIDANQDVGAVPRSVFITLSLDGAEIQRTLIAQSN